MDFKNILHNKLFLIGGGLVALFVVIRLVMGASGGTAATTTVSTVTQPTDAQVAASAQITLAQINANTSLATAQLGAAANTSQTNAQLTAQTQALQEQLAEKGVDADVSKYSIGTDATVAMAQIQAQQVAQERDDDLQANIAQWTLQTQAADQASNNNFQLAYAASANATSIATAQIVAGVNMASIQAQSQTTIAALQASAAQVQSEIAGQVQINADNDATSVANTQTQASVTKYTQGSGNVKGILGAIGSIFSDRRLKEDVVLLGRDPDGLGHYAYRYRGDPSFQVGRMADEVKRLRSWAMGPRVAGFDTVRYSLV